MKRIDAYFWLAIALLGIAALWSCKGAGSRPYTFILEPVAGGFDHPTSFAVPPDGSGRIFVTEQTGRIKIIDSSGAVLPFLDLGPRMVPPSPAYDESGLLGLAFHPDFASNGRFFVLYNAPPSVEGFHSDVHVSEFLAPAGGGSSADNASEAVLLSVPHPQFNHNGGQLAFGPDGYLYIGIGDGGNRDDVGTGHTPDLGNAQDLTKLLGKILRVDVSAPGIAAVPPDNPFAADPGARPEIYAYGFRNPWRFSFDRGGGNRLFSADVGQSLYEEINIVQPGGNYGWNVREGLSCLNTGNDRQPLDNCSSTGASGEPLIDPIIVYGHPGSREPVTGRAAIGGYVYRGAALAGLEGAYVFGDWSRTYSRPTGSLLVAAESGPGAWSFSEAAVRRPGGFSRNLDLFLLSLGEDESGELYLLTSRSLGPGGASGEVYRISAVELQPQ